MKAAGQHGRTYDNVNDQLITCGSLIALSKIVMLERKVPLVVSMLKESMVVMSKCWSRCSSKSKKKKMLFWIVNTFLTLISLSTMMAVWTEVMSFNREVQQMVMMMKAVIMERTVVMW